MKHTRPTITEIRVRIEKQAAARDYWMQAALTDPDPERRSAHELKYLQALALINELRDLIGER